MVEEYAEWFRSSYGLDVVTLRYGNVYGPRQDPSGDAGVIAIFCERLLTGRPPIVFGDGTQTRDFVYVGDVAAANLAAADADSLPHRVYNVGTGTEVSIRELLRATATAAGADPDAVVAVVAPRGRARCTAAVSTSAAPSANSSSTGPCRWSRACAAPSAGSAAGEMTRTPACP